jgi:serine/threonine protein kinase
MGSAPVRLVTPPHDTAVGRRFGPYQFTACLGRGGCAVVYQAKRRGWSGFEKPVAVKTILPELARNRRFTRLFREEAKLSAHLLHTNIAQVHDFGMVGDVPFLEMELLTGWNLRQLWQRLAERGERMPPAIALAVVTEACRGLAYAHAFVDEHGVHRPIIHCDISPSNVMIGKDGVVKLLDFGLARLTRGETLNIDTFQGKLAYMSPEQLESKKLDRRADVFAVGVLLHELLSGQRLFAVDDDVGTVRRVRSLQVDPPSALRPGIPAALDAIVLRALARDPSERQPSAVDLLAALDKLSARAASRTQLLSYLGTIAPEIYTTPCESCGQQIANGMLCLDCHTPVSMSRSLLLDEPAPPPPRPAPAPKAAGLWALVLLMWCRLLLLVKRQGVGS